MGGNLIKSLFIFITACAMLLPYFAFFAVLPAQAQGTGDFVINPPTFQLPPKPELNLGVSKAELIELSPEIKRLDQQYNEAKPNEGIVQKRVAAQEVTTKSCSVLDIKCWFQALVEGVIFAIISIPVGISEFFFDWMLLMNLNGSLYTSDFVRVGWGISRDIANMFFIFFVLWMALATIFQFDSYSAKRLLPKLIIVALLVNFSLPIGLFVIRTTNAIAKVFYDIARTTPIETASGVRVTSLAQQIAVISYSTDVRQAAEFSNEASPTATITEDECDRLLADTQSAGINSESQKIADAYNRCIMGNIAVEAQQRSGVWGFMGIIVAGFWKLIMALIAIFVFFAGAIFLLVRYISLTVFLVFGPLAFLFMILPATQEHWNKWWNKLIQWSFFLPVFMFMIMLSIRLSTSIFRQNIGPTDLASLSVQYILVMGLFIASLMIANSMGIAMSGTVVGWGRSMARGAGRYAKGKGIQYAKIGAGGIAGGIQSNALLQKTLSAIPLLGGTMARGLGKTRAMGEAAEKARQKGKFGFAERLSDEARANYIASERSGNARDLLAKMDDGDRRRTVNALSTQDQIELAQKLRSVQAEALVGNATNNPEVYARMSGEAGSLADKDYPAKVAKIAHEKFKAENIAPDFLRGTAGREYLKTVTEQELRAIAQTRKGAEALGETLAEVARTIHEEAQAYITSPAGMVHKDVVPRDYAQYVENIKSQHLSPQTQQYLNTAPGMYGGRMAMRIRKKGGDNNEEEEDEKFERRIRRAAKRGMFKPPEE